MHARTRVAARAVAVAVGLAAGAYAAYVAVAWRRYGQVRAVDPHLTDELLDEFMPAYDVVERHHIRVAAPAHVTVKRPGSKTAGMAFSLMITLVKVRFDVAPGVPVTRNWIFAISPDPTRAFCNAYSEMTMTPGVFRFRTRANPWAAARPETVTFCACTRRVVGDCHVDAENAVAGAHGNRHVDEDVGTALRVVRHAHGGRETARYESQGHGDSTAEGTPRHRATPTVTTYPDPERGTTPTRRR